MKLSRVKLTNVRGFRGLDISFGSTCASLLITGDNGDGKSTVLRSIALGMSDTLGSLGLLSELPGSFIKYGESQADIEIELQGLDKHLYKIVTSVEGLNGNTEIVKQTFWKRAQSSTDWNNKNELPPSQFPCSDLFGAGYGAGLRTLGTERYQHYYITDSVYTLFKSDVGLQEQELVIRRLADQRRLSSKRKSDLGKRIVSILERILHLRKDTKILLKPNGIFFTRSGDSTSKSETELTAMGDDVRAVVTVVLDLMSWWYLNLNDKDQFDSMASDDTEAITGVVLIDEVEKHLHPSWQREIIGNLLSTFPRVQFILTTHAPLCVSGATDFETKKIFLYRTLQQNDGRLYGHPYTLPQSYTADEVLTSEAFGLETTLSPKLEDLLEEIRPLIENTNRKPDEDRRLEKLLDSLGKIAPATAEQQRDIELDRRLSVLTETAMKRAEQSPPKSTKK